VSGSTPGPWEVVNGARGSFVVRHLEVTALGSRISRPIVKTFRCSEDAANARLIAAAPDLLAFVERVAKSDEEAKAIGISSGVLKDRAHEARGLLAKLRDTNEGGRP
jgi:hypothetical protein